MLRLRVLGGALVEGPDGPLGGTAGQRKSLALLALLGPSDRGMSRDKILAYLWPETETERAGHRLTQLIYALRRDLQADDLFLGTGELRLNPGRITCDVREFSAARQAGDLARAAAVYGGPFLDGFFLSHPADFERWVENERAGLARDYAEILETLAAEAGARGDSRLAAEWWRQLADHDPLSSRVTVHLMSALAAAGSRADAIERARAYQELVQRELEAAPNPAVLALAQQLREHPPEPGASPTVAIPVAVLPFANLTPAPENDFFSEGLMEELMSGLGRIGGVRVASRSSVRAVSRGEADACEIGRRLGVDALLEGGVRQAEGRIRLTAQLVDTADGCQIWSERYEREAGSAFAVQDELCRLIVAAVGSCLQRLGQRKAAPAPPSFLGR